MTTKLKPFRKRWGTAAVAAVAAASLVIGQASPALAAEEDWQEVPAAAGVNSHDTPAVVSYNTTPFATVHTMLAYRASDGTQLWSERDNAAPVAIPEAFSNVAPAIIQWDGYIVVVYTGTNGAIYLSRYDTHLEAWGLPISPFPDSVRTFTSPAVTVAHGRLYIAYTSSVNRGINTLSIVNNNGTYNFDLYDELAGGARTDNAPSIATLPTGGLNDELVIAHRGRTNNQIYSTVAHRSNADNGRLFGSGSWQAVSNLQSRFGPHVAVAGQALRIGVRDMNDHLSYIGGNMIGPSTDSPFTRLDWGTPVVDRNNWQLYTIPMLFVEAVTLIMRAEIFAGPNTWRPYNKRIG
jgi:hypothetical protein